MKAGQWCGKGQGDGGHKSQQLLRGVRTGRQPPGFAQVGGEEADQDIRQVQQKELLDVQLLFHRSSSLRLFRSTTACFTSSLNWLNFASTDGCSDFSAFLTFLPVYSVKAAVRASASRPLKRSGTWAGSCCDPSSPHNHLNMGVLLWQTLYQQERTCPDD